MTEQQQTLETRIVYYNDLYRKGTPEVSDQVFDSLLEEFEKQVSKADYDRVRLSLFSATGDIRHQYIIGSLKKTKAEDDSITKWFNKHNVTNIMIVEKIDGMSIVLHYNKGRLFKAVTRGDGEYGKDQTEKLLEIVGDIQGSSFTGQIRGEILLSKSGLKELNEKHGTSYKNPRNAVTGIIGNKDVDPFLLSFCSVLAYQIMGSNESKIDQYNELGIMGFNIPKQQLHLISKSSNGTTLSVSPNNLKAIYEDWTSKSDYEIDGLVIHDLKYIDENLKLPIHTIAFKVNDLVGTTTVKGIEWNMSRDKKFKPVVLLEPIELGGATIKRATGNNLRFILKHYITNGSTVTIEKAGDIIPKIVNVIPNMNGVSPEIPRECPSCKHTLRRNEGIDLFCSNQLCDGNAVKQITKFIRDCGVEGFSESSIEKFKIKTVQDLLAFYPSDKSGNQNKFMDELFGKIFNKTKRELIINLPFHGFGQKSIESVLNTYGKNHILRHKIPVPGMSTERQKEFKRQFRKYIYWVMAITSDGRWKPSKVATKSTSPLSTKLKGVSFCFTGKMETMSRSDAQNFVKLNGGEVKSVSNKLTYLVTNNPNSGTSKNKKAQALGVQLITEKQFGELIGKKIDDKKVVQQGQMFDIADL